MVKNASYLGVSSLIIQATNILMYMIVARYLAQDDFATFRQMFLIQSIILAVFISSLPLGMLYFTGKTERSDEQIGYLGTFVCIAFTLAIVISIVLKVGSEQVSLLFNNPYLQPILSTYSLATFGFISALLLPYFLLVIKQLHFNILIAIGLGLTLNIPIVYLAYLGNSLQIIVEQLAFIQIFVGCLLFGFMFYKTLPTFLRSANKQNFIAIYIYLWPLFLATTLSIVGLKIDHIIVSGLLGVSLYALYSVGAFELPVFSVAQSAMTSSLMPTVTKHVQKQEYQEAQILWRKANKQVAWVTFPIACMLIFFADFFITLFFGTQYEPAGYIFAIFTLLVFIRVMHFGLILKAQGNTRYELYANVIYLIISISGAYVITANFGMLGAATWVLVTTSLLGIGIAILTYYSTNKKFQLFRVYPWQELLVSTLLLGGLYALFQAPAQFELTAIPEVIGIFLIFALCWAMFIIYDRRYAAN